ncbi:serine/arginine repetitive matrix protein 1 [Nocardioidaceae bacterium Broad-1]|nr:serine/arginine repetitive matrix protein 1 [Nocardioidaceae bacterium Broad-1]
MGNHRADVTSDSPRSVTPSPGATTSSSYVGKRRAAPATDSPASRPAPRATGSTSYVGKRRAAPSPAVGTATPTPAPETVEEPVAKARPNRVVLEQTGKMPVVGSPRDTEATDGRISTGELRALVEGDGGPSFPATFPTTPPAPQAPRPIVPVQRRAAQIDPVLADLLSSMGIDPDKVTPEVLEDLGVGGMTTSELTKFLTQPTKPAPMRAALSTPVSTKTPPRGIPAAPAPSRPEPVAPVAPVVPAAPAAPVAPEPTFQAPEPTHTPKPLRMANTFAPLTGKVRAVRAGPPDPGSPGGPGARSGLRARGQGAPRVPGGVRRPADLLQDRHDLVPGPAGVAAAADRLRLDGDRPSGRDLHRRRALLRGSAGRRAVLPGRLRRRLRP